LKKYRRSISGDSGILLLEKKRCYAETATSVSTPLLTLEGEVVVDAEGRIEQRHGVHRAQHVLVVRVRSVAATARAATWANSAAAAAAAAAVVVIVVVVVIVAATVVVHVQAAAEARHLAFARGDCSVDAHGNLLDFAVVGKALRHHLKASVAAAAAAAAALEVNFAAANTSAVLSVVTSAPAEVVKAAVVPEPKPAEPEPAAPEIGHPATAVLWVHYDAGREEELPQLCADGVQGGLSLRQKGTADTTAHLKKHKAKKT